MGENSLFVKDPEKMWKGAVFLMRSSMSESDCSRLDRYMGMVTTHREENGEYVVGFNGQMAVDLWQSQNYGPLLEEALHDVGLPEEMKVTYAVREKEPEKGAAAAPQTDLSKPYREQTRMAQAAANAAGREPADRTAATTAISGLGAEAVRAAEGRGGKLEPSHTFENFVRGPSNEFAHSCAVAVANGPGRTMYNPLFIYGGTGLGKTHLMEAIGNQVRNAYPRLSVCYITSETFLNEYITALANGEIQAFRERYRRVDVLLLDDVQFIAGKKQFQEEFFNTYNSLMQSHKQVVMTSDVAPKNLKGCEERLIGRFQQGMPIEIEKPSYETRLAILKFKVRAMNRTLPEEVLTFIAANISSHVRAIEGALYRMVAFMDYNPPGTPLTLDSAKGLLRDQLEEQNKYNNITIKLIMERVAGSYSVDVGELTSQHRPAALVTPRQVAMYLSKKLTRNGLKEIAAEFNKSHATVHHGVQTMQKRMDVEPDLRDKVREIISSFDLNPDDVMQ